MLIFAQDQTISLKNIHSSTITPTSYTKTSLKLVRLQPRTLELNSLNTEKREAHIQDTESFQKETKSLFCYHKTATICLCDTKDLTAYRKSRMTTITYVKSGKKLKTYHANLLKKFEERQPLPPHDTILPHAAVSFIKEDNDDLKKHLYRSQYCRYPTCPNRLLYSPTPQIKH